MSIEEIEAAISELPPEALAELADWFAEFHASAWDRQIEDDIRSGKLDPQAGRARDAFTSGLCKLL